MMINKKDSIPPFLQLGFRPFFFVAGLAAFSLMLLWLLFYQDILPTGNIHLSYWHAHEMIFSYCSVVIVGFLLTASKNWTGIQTIYGKPLLALLFLWLIGRSLTFVDNQYIVYQAIVDTSFLILSTFAIAYPIFKSKSWPHLAVLTKVLLLALAHIVYYLGILGYIDDGANYGLYSGFYLVISILLMMSRKLLPFFIEKGLQLDRKLKNSKIIDISSLVLFLAFAILEIFFNTKISNILAASLFLIHGLRAFWWFDKQILQKPLLWSIYLSYCFIIIGFAINFLKLFFFILPNIDIHAFAFSIGLMTLSMMARVSLGHTGRNLSQPPKILNTVFILLSLSFVFRVIMPVFMLHHYSYWILASQVLWIISFLIFIWVYTPIFFKARIDGKFG